MTDKKEYMKRLSQCVAKWQNLLKLNEWNIAIGIGTRETLKDKNGSISYIRENGQALLTIIDPDEAITIPFGYDGEATIVAQLLKLRYEAIDDPDPDIYLARAHKIVAKLLVDLKMAADAYHRMIEEMEGAEESEKVEAPKKTPRVINT